MRRTLQIAALSMSFILIPTLSLAYVPPSDLFDVPDDESPPIPLLNNMQGASSSNSNSNSSTNNSSNSGNSSSSSRQSSSLFINTNRGAVDPNVAARNQNARGQHDAAPYLGGNVLPPPPPGYQYAPDPNYTGTPTAYPPPVVSVRTAGSRGNLSGTGPGEVLAFATLLISAVYTIRRAFKRDQLPV